MKQRRILVSGSRGFVGQHVLRHLASAFPTADLHPSHSDITDEISVSTEVANIRPHICVHLAAISAIPAAHADPKTAWKVNLHGSLNLARAVQKHVPDCLFLFASSATVYGLSFHSDLALDETALLAPTNTYAATKAAADLALGAMAIDGLRVVRLRAFNHTGPGQSGEFVIANFARQLARIKAGQQEPVVSVGNLTPKRDFLDVRDVCAAYSACIRHADQLEPGVIINIASGVPRQLRDVLNDMIRECDIDVKIRTEDARLRSNDTLFAIGDASRARVLLGWDPLIAWPQTLREVLADWRGRVEGAC